MASANGFTSMANTGTSLAASGVTLGNALFGTGTQLVSGAAAGTLGALTWGGALGFAGLIIGIGLGIYSHNQAQDAKIEQYMIRREAATRDRNRAIRDFKRVYSATKTDFDTKYGSGLFDTLNLDFQKLIGITNDKALASVLTEMSYDNVSGKITTYLSDVITDAERDKFTSNTFNLQDFGKEYIRVLGENLRKADTEFGLQMQSLSEQEKSLIEDYQGAMAEARLQIANSFRDAFFNRQSQLISEHSTMGQASVAQATSGLRQTDSGANLTIQQEFQMDLSKVAYVSAMDYYIQQYTVSAENRTRQLMSNRYQIRNSIAQGTKAAQAAINSAIQQANENTIATMDTVKSKEGEVDVYNEAISDANDSKFFHGKDEHHDTFADNNLTGDIF